MTTAVVAVRPDDTVERAAKLMYDGARACVTAQCSASPSRNAFIRTVLRASTRTS